nr:reverse transcriptase domain-containing protein [Tanacetum cinerariifolium]
MIQQVQNTCQFHELPGDDSNRHIDKFLEVTQHIKQNEVFDDALSLSLFLYSLTHHATAWYDRLIRNSIHTFDDMMRKFLSKYFPPSMVTKLRNEIMKFRQDPNESLFKEWEHYKLSIDRCGGTFMQKTPEECYELIENMTTHHNHWDTSATRDETSRNISSTTTTESPEVVRQLETINKNFLDMMRQIQSIKSVDTKCETCGGPHSYTECPAVGGYTQEAAYATTGNHNSEGNSYQPQGYNQNRGNNFNQGNYQVPNNQVQVQPSNELSNYMNINETNMRAMQNQINTMRTEMKNDFETSMAKQQNELKNMMTSFLQMQTPSGSGSLPSNTVANPRGDLKAITTRSGVAYDGPTIPPTPSPLPKVVKRETEATKDKVQASSLEGTTHVQPAIIQVTISDPEVALKPNPKSSITYPSRLNDQKLRYKDNNQMLKFLQIFQRLHFDISFADALFHMLKFASTFKSLLSNNEKLFELASTLLNENCSAVLLKKFPEKLGDPGKFLILCDFLELEEYLALDDLVDYVDPRVPLIFERPFLRTKRALIDVHVKELTLRVNDEAITFKVGHTSGYSRNYHNESVNRIDVIDVSCEEYAQEVLGFLDSSMSGNHTPSDSIIASYSSSFTPFEGHDLSSNLPPLKNEDLKQADVTMRKPSIEEPPELELKDIPSHLEYAFLEGTNKLPVIISKELKDEEKAALLTVLKSHKQAIAWKISDIKGIEPCFCTHKILMEEDFKPAVLHQKRVNPKIHEVIKKEVIKLVDAGLIYPISDSPWYLAPSDAEAPIEDHPLPDDASPTALSPGYVADSDSEEDPEEDPTDGGVDGDDESSNDDDGEEEASDDDDDEEEEEEHPALADSSDVPVDELVPSAEDTDAFETDESAPTHALIAEYAFIHTLPSPPPSLLSPISSPLPQIPSPPLPLPSPPTTSPTYPEAPLGYRAVVIRLRAASPSTHHLSEILSPPLLLPSTSHKDDIPKADMPLQKSSFHCSHFMSSDSHATITYTSMSSYEGIPLPAAVSPTAESPRDIADSEPEMDPEEEDGDDEKSEGDFINYPTSRGDDDADDDGDELLEDDADDEDEDESSDKPFEEGETAATPPPSAYRVAARISIRPHIPMPFRSESKVERLLAIPTPSLSPVSPTSYPLLPFLMPLPIFTPLPPPPPIILSHTRASMVLMRSATPSTFILAPRSRTPLIGTPPLLPIPLPITSFPLPLLLPSTSGSESILEADMPLRKRTRFTTPLVDMRLRRERRYFRTLSTTYTRERDVSTLQGQQIDDEDRPMRHIQHEHAQRDVAPEDGDNCS